MPAVGLKRRLEQKKENIKNNIDFNIPWLPQKRQLTFLKSIGLDYPFRYYVIEDEDGTITKVRREEIPSGPTEPKADIILYGGAAGGGKSDALLMALFIAALSFPGCSCGYFRRKFTQLEGAKGPIMRSRELFSDFPGAQYNKKDHRWTFTEQNNSIIDFNHIKHEENLYDYQSQQFGFMAFDEATQFTERMYTYMTSRNRSSVNGVIPVMLLASNPGNIGHNWAKRDFISPGKPEKANDVEIRPGVYRKHMFIPAKLADNYILEKRDPRYRKKLEGQSEKDKERLLEGSWDIHEGQFFSEFRRDIHVLEPEDIDINDNWKRFISIDYGLDCSAVYWYAVDTFGIYYCYKGFEVPDLILSSLAKKILDYMNPIEKDSLVYIVGPPDLFNRRERDTGKSGKVILRENGLKGIRFKMADTRRVEGWRVVKEMLRPIPDPLETDDVDDEDAKKVARLMFINNRVDDLINNLPKLQQDDDDPNDVATQPHDITHGADSLRYFCMSRPMERSSPKDESFYREQFRQNRLKPRSKVTNY